MSMRPARAMTSSTAAFHGGFVRYVGGYVFKPLGGLFVSGEFKNPAACAGKGERSAAPDAAASAGYNSDFHVPASFAF